MPELFVYAIVAGVALLVLFVLFLVLVRGFRPKRGSSDLDGDSGFMGPGGGGTF